jgi:hypothetical protein
MIGPTSHSFDFGGEELSFSIERTTRRKTVSISVGYNGVRVLAPTDLSDTRLPELSVKKASWILRKEAGGRKFLPGRHRFSCQATFGVKYGPFGRSSRLA